MQRSRRVQCNTGFLSQLMDLLDRTVRMFASLCMDRDDIRPACRCLFDITFRLFYHQMDVKYHIAHFPDGFDDRESK